MKIGIDCRLWQESGVGRYIRNLVSNLAEIDKTNKYVLFANTPSLDVNLPKHSTIVQVDIPWHGWKEQVVLPWFVNKINVDLVHSPYFNVPILSLKPFVATIHDLTIDHFATGRASTRVLPLYWLKRLGYHLSMRKATSYACKIIVPSYATADELINHYHIPTSSIAVIYEGGINTNMSAKKPSFIAKEKIDKFFLYVGNAYPHKNLDRLIVAFNRYKQQNHKIHNDTKLMLVGKEDYFYKKLKTSIAKNPFAESMIFSGAIPDAELLWLYKHAKALILPSLMEGFGLPALEAMQQGCLVLASNISVFKEICGEAAVYFDPRSVEELSEKIYKSYMSYGSYKSYIERGFEQAKKFSWKKTAKETLKVYESCFSL